MKTNGFVIGLIGSIFSALSCLFAKIYQFLFEKENSMLIVEFTC